MKCHTGSHLSQPVTRVVGYCGPKHFLVAVERVLLDENDNRAKNGGIVTTIVKAGTPTGSAPSALISFVRAARVTHVAVDSTESIIIIVLLDTNGMYSAYMITKLSITPLMERSIDPLSYDTFVIQEQNTNRLGIIRQMGTLSPEYCDLSFDLIAGGLEPHQRKSGLSQQFQPLLPPNPCVVWSDFDVASQTYHVVFETNNALVELPEAPHVVNDRNAHQLHWQALQYNGKAFVEIVSMPLQIPYVGPLKRVPRYSTQYIQMGEFFVRFSAHNCSETFYFEACGQRRRIPSAPEWALLALTMNCRDALPSRLSVQLHQPNKHVVLLDSVPVSLATVSKAEGNGKVSASLCGTSLTGSAASLALSLSSPFVLTLGQGVIAVSEPHLEFVEQRSARLRAQSEKIRSQRSRSFSFSAMEDSEPEEPSEFLDETSGPVSDPERLTWECRLRIYDVSCFHSPSLVTVLTSSLLPPRFLGLCRSGPRIGTPLCGFVAPGLFEAALRPLIVPRLATVSHGSHILLFDSLTNSVYGTVPSLGSCLPLFQYSPRGLRTQGPVIAAPPPEAVKRQRLALLHLALLHYGPYSPFASVAPDAARETASQFLAASMLNGNVSPEEVLQFILSSAFVFSSRLAIPLLKMLPCVSGGFGVFEQGPYDEASIRQQGDPVFQRLRTKYDPTLFVSPAAQVSGGAEDQDNRKHLIDSWYNTMIMMNRDRGRVLGEVHQVPWAIGRDPLPMFPVQDKTEFHTVLNYRLLLSLNQADPDNQRYNARIAKDYWSLVDTIAGSVIQLYSDSRSALAPSAAVTCLEAIVLAFSVLGLVSSVVDEFCLFLAANGNENMVRHLYRSQVLTQPCVDRLNNLYHYSWLPSQTIEDAVALSLRTMPIGDRAPLPEGDLSDCPLAPLARLVSQAQELAHDSSISPAIMEQYAAQVLHDLERDYPAPSRC